MAEEANISSTRRFGPRYGRKVRKRFGTIESEQRKLHKCPYCNAVKVKRISLGIWNCKKCGAKFSGKAYSVRRKVSLGEEETEEPEEKEEEKEEE
jgi:large subunit ribosomal protein L37Ae